MAYQGYGQSPQAYGQQAGPYGQMQTPPSDNKEELDDQYYSDVSCCNSKSGFARLDNWCIFICCMGGLLCLISTFIPYWRLDSVGTKDLDLPSDYRGFNSRSYGVIHVKATWSQSWTTMAQGMCDVRNIGQVTGIIASGWSLVTSGDVTNGCSGSDLCQQ